MAADIQISDTASVFSAPEAETKASLAPCASKWFSASRNSSPVSSLMKRMASGEDVANVVRFLASPAAAYVSGAQIAVHGGGERPSFLALAKDGG